MSESKKLWKSRFKQDSAEILDEFNSSFAYDRNLYKQDIEASIAHVEMLSKQSIIDSEAKDQIIDGLKKIETILEEEIRSEQKEVLAEDIHMFVEEKLTLLIGDNAKKLHTARSRNDQVITDLRLWVKDQVEILNELLKELRQEFINKAESDIDIVVSGYTHLQQAQNISLGHFWLAHEARFFRDSQRLEDSIKRLMINPLGSGALAGSTFSIDREETTKRLGFDRASENSLDAVSDRDFVAEYEFILSMIMIHLSQFAEEMIIWNSQEFNYIEISDAFATGSSMMPQKKNPDIPELLRGKTGRVIGVMNALLITLKALPLAYNKDLQEDKELLFMANDTVQKSITITIEFIKNIKANKESMEKNAAESFNSATDIAEYLVKKGHSFRDAYSLVGNLVQKTIDKEIKLKDLRIEDFKEESDDFEEDILGLVEAQNTVDARDIPGATSRKQVKKAIDYARNRL